MSLPNSKKEIIEILNDFGFEKVSSDKVELFLSDEKCLELSTEKWGYLILFYYKKKPTKSAFQDMLTLELNSNFKKTLENLKHYLENNIY